MATLVFTNQTMELPEHIAKELFSQRHKFTGTRRTHQAAIALMELGLQAQKSNERKAKSERRDK